MKRMRYLIPMVIIAAIAGISGGGAVFHKEKESPESAQPVRPISTTIARRLDISEIRSFPGYVKAARRVEMAFPVSGIILDLKAEKGRRVRRGEVLARLDERDFQHTLNSTKAIYMETKSALDRIKKLHVMGIVSSAEYERVQAAYDIAAAELQIREKALSDTVLLAPFDGLIADRYVENHEHVREKAAVLSLHDLSKVEVIINVAEPLIRDGGIGSWQNIQVSFDGKSNCGRVEVKEIRARRDSVTGTYEITLLLPSPENFMLLPGMTATVRLAVTNNKKSGIAIPGIAVCSDSNGDAYVWIILPDGGRPRKQRVTIANRSGDEVEVVSGLYGGEHVATAGTHSLSESQAVRPIKTRKNGIEE